jgi:hypothetical protein
MEKRQRSIRGIHSFFFSMCVEIAGNFGCTFRASFILLRITSISCWVPGIDLTRTLRYDSGFVRRASLIPSRLGSLSKIDIVTPESNAKNTSNRFKSSDKYNS